MGKSGKTIAVLGSGFNNIFPPENVNLFNQIIESGGLVITEYELEDEMKSEYFPVRNRIISGLSLGVLVVEAGKIRSGASLTATIALEQGKKAFCIPCNIDSKNNRTNELILKGVKPVMDVNTILQDCDIKIVGAACHAARVAYHATPTTTTNQYPSAIQRYIQNFIWADLNILTKYSNRQKIIFPI